MTVNFCDISMSTFFRIMWLRMSISLMQSKNDTRINTIIDKQNFLNFNSAPERFKNRINAYLFTQLFMYYDIKLNVILLSSLIYFYLQYLWNIIWETSNKLLTYICKHRENPLQDYATTNSRNLTGHWSV